MSRARMTRTPDIIVTGRTTGMRLVGRGGVAPRGLGARGGRASWDVPVERAGRAAGRPARPVRPVRPGRPVRAGGTGRRGGKPAPLPAVVRPAPQQTSFPTRQIDDATARPRPRSDAPAGGRINLASTSKAGEGRGAGVQG